MGLEPPEPVSRSRYPGDRPPTMADIAADLGISRQLVSLALRNASGASEQTRARVREAARRLGYSPHIGARSLRRSRSRDIGVVFTPAHATEPEIVESIYPAAEAHGYSVVLSAHTSARSTGQAVEELLGHRCAAMILIGSDLDHAGLRALAQRSGVPVVAVGSGRQNDHYDVVDSAGDVGIAQAAQHLAELGHLGIAYVHTPSMPPSASRLEGYRRTVARLGLTGDVLSRRGDYTEEAGAAAARLLLDRPAVPTAIMASNDQVALGLLHVLSRSGLRVPEDVSLTGYDDSRMARLSSVDLTTVRQDPALMGAAAVQAAVRRIDQPLCAAGRTVIEPALVVRSSTAPPRADA
jgi:DNA-binding LacI/PurR family transcriptional regulator